MFHPSHDIDNDFADFRDVALLPTPDELTSDVAPHLPPSDTQGLLADPAAAMAGGVLAASPLAPHLDRQFRLREDFIGPLREEIKLLRADLVLDRNSSSAAAAAPSSGMGKRQTKEKKRNGWMIQAQQGHNTQPNHSMNTYTQYTAPHVHWGSHVLAWTTMTLTATPQNQTFSRR